jgi:hypothetical protein
MNMLATSQYQPRLSSITNVAPGRSANQIAVFTSNKLLGNNKLLMLWYFTLCLLNCFNRNFYIFFEIIFNDLKKINHIVYFTAVMSLFEIHYALLKFVKYHSISSLLLPNNLFDVNTAIWLADLPGATFYLGLGQFTLKKTKSRVCKA